MSFSIALPFISRDKASLNLECTASALQAGQSVPGKSVCPVMHHCAQLTMWPWGPELVRVHSHPFTDGADSPDPSCSMF